MKIPVRIHACLQCGSTTGVVWMLKTWPVQELIGLLADCDEFEVQELARVEAIWRDALERGLSGEERAGAWRDVVSETAKLTAFLHEVRIIAVEYGAIKETMQ
jgi:hypothetical protein